MNQYGAMAQRYWEDYRPAACSTLANPDKFFEDLGEQVATQVQSLSFQMEGKDRPGEGFMEKIGRLNVARAQAEEIVLADLVYLPAEYDQEREDREMLTDMIGSMPPALFMPMRISEMEDRQNNEDPDEDPLTWDQEQLLKMYRKILPVLERFDAWDAADTASPEEISAAVRTLRPFYSPQDGGRMKTPDEMWADAAPGSDPMA